MKNHLENSNSDNSMTTDDDRQTGRVIWRSGTPTHRLSAAPPSRALHHLGMASERRIATLAEQMRWLHTCADPECNGMHDCAGGATGGVAAAGVAAWRRRAWPAMTTRHWKRAQCSTVRPKPAQPRDTRLLLLTLAVRAPPVPLDKPALWSWLCLSLIGC